MLGFWASFDSLPEAAFYYSGNRKNVALFETKRSFLYTGWSVNAHANPTVLRSAVAFKVSEVDFPLVFLVNKNENWCAVSVFGPGIAVNRKVKCVSVISVISSTGVKCQCSVFNRVLLDHRRFGKLGLSSVREVGECRRYVWFGEFKLHLWKASAAMMSFLVILVSECSRPLSRTDVLLHH